MYRVRSCAHCGEAIHVNEPAVMVDEPIVAITAMKSEGAHLWMYFHEACYLASESAGPNDTGANDTGGLAAESR